MMLPERTLFGWRHRLCIAVAIVAASVGGLSFTAFGQDQSAAIAKDAIVARKTAMDVLSDKMDVIEAATVEPAAMSLGAPAPGHSATRSAMSATSSSPKAIVALDDSARCAASRSPRPTAFTKLSTNCLRREPTRRKPAAKPAVPRSR